MKSKILGLGGLPATGKSSLVKEIMKISDDWVEYRPAETLYGHLSRKLNLFVIGLYKEGEKFPGSDRLSMAVQPKAEQYFSSEISTRHKILFEGDRLFNASFLEFLLSREELWETKFAILEASKEEVLSRHFHREDTQSEKFLKGRATKYSNISSNMNLMSYIDYWPNETLEDLELNTFKIKAFLEIS